MSIFQITRGTRIVIMVMTILSIVGIVIAWRYYSGINRGVDPRVKEALVLYGRYNHLVVQGDYREVLALMDSIETVYSSVPHYQNSFEMGVLDNNRGSILLSTAITGNFSDDVKVIYLEEAAEFLQRGIETYTRWLGRFENISGSELMTLLTEEFAADPMLSESENLEAIVLRRKNDIADAIRETPRRLSVSYTNLGIISRHLGDSEGAARYYILAIELWEDNLAARNNLNLLLGKPLEKHGLLRRLFPPDRL